MNEPLIVHPKQAEDIRRLRPDVPLLITESIPMDITEPKIVKTKIIPYRYPPGWKQAILKVFPGASAPGILFAYDHDIYVPNPNSATIPSWLIAHEHVHFEQQDKYGPDEWWQTYLVSPKFRAEQEKPAHWVEYNAWLLDGSLRNRHERRGMHKAIATRLSGPLYNHCMSLEAAKKYLKQRTP